MGLVDVVKDSASLVKEKLTGPSRAALLADLAALATPDEKDLALERRIADTMAEIDRMEEPRRRLLDLEREQLSCSRRKAERRSEVERQLHASVEKRRDWREDRARRENLMAFLRSEKRPGPPPPDEVRHNLTGAVVEITNLAEIRKYHSIGPLLARHVVEMRDTLWRLDDEALTARLRERKTELDDALDGTAFEGM